jgi:hypothetical protein
VVFVISKAVLNPPQAITPPKPPTSSNAPADQRAEGRRNQVQNRLKISISPMPVIDVQAANGGRPEVPVNRRFDIRLLGQLRQVADDVDADLHIKGAQGWHCL